MMKGILANLYQKCVILCSTILLNVLHNMSLTVLLQWQHTGFQISPIFKAFLATFGIPFWYLLMVPHMHDPTNITMIAWVRGWSFSSWKSLAYWNQVGRDWKRVSCHGNIIFYSRRCISCRTISLPSFSGLRCKLTKIALFVYLM